MSAVDEHREKATKVSAMVSRPLGRAEMLTNAKAMEAMKKEWQGLIDLSEMCQYQMLFAIRERKFMWPERRENT